MFFIASTWSTMVRVARQMVQGGRIGELRVVQAEYPQDWLTNEVHNKQAD